MSRLTEILRKAGFAIESRRPGEHPVWRDKTTKGRPRFYPQPEAFRLAVERLKRLSGND